MERLCRLLRPCGFSTSVQCVPYVFRQWISLQTIKGSVPKSGVLSDNVLCEIET